MASPGAADGGSEDGGNEAAGDPRLAPRPAAELLDGLKAREDRLRSEYTQVFLADDETTRIGGGPKRFVKRAITRVIRPVVRRYDRLLADAAGTDLTLAASVANTQRTLAELTTQTREIAAELRAVGQRTGEHDVRIGRAATELELLARRLDAGVVAPTVRPETGAGSGAAPAASSGGEQRQVLPDAFYWRFETALRGGAEAVTSKLEAYRELADRLRRRHGTDALWLDLGCGEGRFMELLRDWGWNVLGMDHSPQAVEACAAIGLEAMEGSLPDFLLTFDGGTPAAMSLIQVVEHLPTETWLPTLRYAERLLAPGGALVIETIDPRNPEALQAFFADVTHTWAAHPETLRVMAGFAGFAETEVIDLNPGDNGRAQDFALIATKA